MLLTELRATMLTELVICLMILLHEACLLLLSLALAMLLNRLSLLPCVREELTLVCPLLDSKVASTATPSLLLNLLTQVCLSRWDGHQSSTQRALLRRDRSL